jgi:pimeloyl-ACP methyl ester carboxylesterase
MSYSTGTRDDGGKPVVEDGDPAAPAVPPTDLWDPMIPALAASCHLIRVEPLGRGKPAGPDGGYDVPAQVSRISAALDRLGVHQVTAIGHSSGGYLATALAERRRGTVKALALVNTGPSLDAKIPDGVLLRFLQAPVPGRLLWPFRTADTIRKAARTGFTRPVEIPDAMIEYTVSSLARAESRVPKAGAAWASMFR